MDMAGSGCYLISYTTLAFAWRDGGKPQNLSQDSCHPNWALSEYKSTVLPPHELTLSLSTSVPRGGAVDLNSKLKTIVHGWIYDY
jgi:hypothetical protein